MSQIDLFLDEEERQNLLKDPMLSESEDAFDSLLSGGQGVSFDKLPGDQLFEDEQESQDLQEMERVIESIKEAKQTNPDQAVKIKRLADKSGYPEEIVLENPEGVEASIQTQQTREILEDSPKLKKAAIDLSRFGHDDLDNLSTFERLHTDFTVGLDRGMLTRELGLLNRKLMGEIFRDTTGIGELNPEEKQEIRNRITEIKEQLPGSHGSGGFIEAAANALGTFIEGVPQVLAAGAIGAGATAAGASVFGPGGTVAGALTGFGVSATAEVFRQSSAIEGGILRDSLVDEGVDKDIANRVGEVGGAFAGLLETIGQVKFMAEPFKNALKKRFFADVKKRVLQDAAQKRGLAAGVGTFSKTLGKTVAGETATELGQEIIQTTGEEVGKAIDPGEHESITMEEFGSRMFEVLKETMKAMVVLGTPGAVTSVVSDHNKANQADKNEAFMNEMGASVQASKLAARDEKTYSEFVDKVAEDSETQNVYIDAEKLQEVYQSDTATLLEEIGATEQFEVALENKGDIFIPLSTYTTKIARDVEAHSKILKHTKFDPNGNTPFQVEVMRKEQDKFNTIADKIIEQQQSNQPFTESGGKVFQSIQQQLVETGRFDQETANQYAILHQAFAESQAKRETATTGKVVLPEHIYEKFGLKISGQPIVSEQVQTLEQGDIRIFRGSASPETKLGKKDFDAIFFSRDKLTAEQYGDVQEYVLPEGKLLDAHSPEAIPLVQEFLKYNPDVLTEKIKTLEKKIKEAPDPGTQGTYQALLDEITFEVYETPEDIIEENINLFMFPDKEWTKFLSSKGYVGTALGEDIAIHDEKALEEIQKTRPTDSPNILNQSAVPIQKKPLKIEGTGKKGKITNWDIADAFTKRHDEKYGRKLDPQNNEEDYKIVLRELNKEYKDQAKKEDAGADWYIQDINEAVEITKLIIPELSDPIKKDVFLAIVAFTSPNNNPINNWEVAVQVMQGYLKTGKIPTKRENGKNLGVTALRLNTQLFQKLITMFGEKGALQWISGPKTGREMAQLRMDSGLYTKKKTLAGYVAGETNLSSDYPFGAAAMGPKVSEFFANVVGLDQESVTVDLWAARTYNRMIGRLLDVSKGKAKSKTIVQDLRGKAERDIIKRLFRDLAKKNNTDPSAMQAALWYFEQRLFRNHGAIASSENFTGGATRAAGTRKINIPRTSEDAQGTLQTEAGNLREIPWNEKGEITKLFIRGPWDEKIISGGKTLEVRGRAIPAKHIGVPIVLKNENNEALGEVVFKGSRQVKTAKEFNKLRKQHQVEKGSEFDFGSRKETHVWEIESVEPYTQPQKLAPMKGQAPFQTERQELFQAVEDISGKKEGLYSAVRRSLEDMNLPAWKKDADTYPKVGQANGKDIWAKLKTMPGIKAEELKWMGIQEWLTGNPKAKFTRDQAVTFAKNNGVNVETVVAALDSNEGDFTGIAWGEERVWDDPEAWQPYVEDAGELGIKEDAIATVRKEKGHNIPKDLEEDVESQLDLEETKNEWIEKNYESEIEEQIEAIARERYMENPIYIIESMDDDIDLSIFGNDELGWSIRKGGWRQHENTVNYEPIYSLNEAEVQADDYAINEGLAGFPDETPDNEVKKWEEYIMDGYHENYREIKLTLPEIEGDFYQDTHFPDRNIVAFLRVDDRELGTNPLYTQGVGPDGKKLNTYFIDEFQSDWHQEGRQKGYSTGKSKEEIKEYYDTTAMTSVKVYDALTDLFSESTKGGLELHVPIPGSKSSEVIVDPVVGGYEAVGEHIIPIDGPKFNEIGFDLLRDDFKQDSNWEDYTFVAKLIKEKFDEAEIDKLQDYIAEGDTAKRQAEAERHGVPDAPFKGDSWIALGLKRAIVDAVAGGYEAIAWPNSQVLVDRWSERYRKLYRMQYDKKMPSIVKKLTGEEATHLFSKPNRGRSYGSPGGLTAPSLANKPLADPRDEGYHIIPITDKLKEKVSKEGFALFQEKKGSFQFGEDMTQDESIINLFKKADLSTFLHESGHFFFEAMRHMANDSESSKQTKKDMDALLRFISGDKQITLDTWNNMSLEERRAGHEKVARAFESYLFEGKAPTVNLSNMFRRFRTWLMQVYKNLARLNVTLTDDVRSVFDRMIATDEEILATKQVNDMIPLFTSQETAGMNTDQWVNYQNTVIQEQEEADEMLQAKTLKDMKWLSGARGQVLRKLQREQRERRMGVKQEAAVTIGEQPVYQARQFLRTPVDKKPKKKSDKNVVDPTVDSLFAAIAKLGGLDKDEVIAMWSVDPKDKFKSGVQGNPPVLRNKNKKNPEKNGLSIDRMGMALAELGYLPVDENSKYDSHDFEGRFFDEHSGNKRESVHNDTYDISEAYENFVATEEGYVPLNLEELKGGKLSAPLLRQLYAGREPIWEQLPSKGRYAMVAEDGMDPELIAKVIGFGSADEMIQKLVSAPDMREAVEQETDRRMLELYGDLNSQEAKERAINEALHGPLRERMLHTELSTLSKRVGSGNVLAKAARERAKDHISKMVIKEIRPNDYIMAERRANANAEKALMNGNLEEATNHKRAAVLNYHFAREATKAVDEVERAVRYFNKFDSKGTREKIDIDYLDQIDSALEKYDLRKSVTVKERKRRKGIQKWVNSELDKGNNPVISDVLMKDIGLQHYRDVPLEEIRGLRDSVKNIEHLGRMKDRLLAQVEKIKLDDAAQAIADSIEKFNKQSGRTKKKNKNKFLNEGEHPQDKFGKASVGFYSEHRKMANLGREADGYEENGPWFRYITRPMNERADWEAEQLSDAAERLAKLFDVYSASEFTENLGKYTGGLEESQRLYKRVYVPELDVSLSKMERIMIALNWGNADNRLRVKDGFGWEDSHVEFLLEELDARDWQFVENVWKFIHEYWPQIEAKEKRVSGVAPEKVAGLPVSTKFGTFNAEAEAGYFPITFSREEKKSHDHILADQTKRAMQGDMSRATTARGHTKARMEAAGKKKIRTDFGVIFEHVNAVIHDLAWHEFLIDNNKLLGHDDVVRAIESNMGIDKFNAITNTVKDIAAGEVQNVKYFEKIFNHLRAGVSISAMGWNLGTALLQPFGLTQSMARVGTKWVWKAMLRFFGNPMKINETVAEIHEQSSFMRLRAKTMNREINEIRNKITRSSFFQKQFGAMGESYFTLIAKAQQIADVPTWLAAQEKALATGVDEETAIALADQAVIDSQGSGHIKDLAQIQRGSPLLKLWTNFMSYFQVTFNLTMDSLGKTRWNDAGSIGNLAVDMFMLYTAPIIFSFYLREALLKGKCDHGRDIVCVGKEMAVEHLSYLFGGILLAREGISAVQGFAGYQGPAGSRFFSDLGQFTKQAMQGEIDTPLIKSGAKAIGAVTHFPTGQVIKTIEGIMALESGETDIITAPLFGYSKR
jgi:hypothetical protein